MAGSSDEDEERPNQPPVRRTCSLTVEILRDLKLLKQQGRHGSTVAGIMTNFIEAGIRQAYKDNFLEED